MRPIHPAHHRMAMVSIRDGMTVGGYEILRFIGKGGMGEIWLARQTSIGRDVALKILSPTLVVKNPKFAERFIAEAQAAGRLNHPNIIGVHDVGRVEVDGDLIHYFSMEYVDGENFRQILDRSGPIDAATVSKVMAAMADALSYAHGIGMIHRDIKPENIMMTKDGRVKLADFGLAMQVDSAEATEVERDDAGRIKVMGTPLYMSPEQARGRPLDFRSDLYSLGASLYHFLTGRPSFRRNTSKEVMRAHVHEDVPDPADIIDCPESWRHLCMQLMAKDPAERAESPESFRLAVQDAIANQHEAPRRRRHATQASPRHRRGPGGAVQAIAVLALVIVIGLVVVLMLTRDKGSGEKPPRVDTASNGENPSDDPATDREKRVTAARSFLAKLPPDHADALRQVAGQEGLRNAYFIAEPAAMDLLREKEQQLLAVTQAADQKRREAMETVIAEAELALRGGHLDQAAEQLAKIPESDRRLVQKQYDELHLRLERELDYLSDGALTEIKRSSAADSILAAVEQVKAKGLSGERLATVEQAAAERKVEIDQQAAKLAAQQKELVRQRWGELVDLLDSARRAGPDSSGSNAEPDYRRFTQSLKSFKPRLEADPRRIESISALEQVCSWSEAMSAAVVESLRKNPYKVSLPLPNGAARGHIVSFERGRFTIEIEWPRATLIRPIDNGDISLEDLLARAATDTGLGDVAQHIAAFYWMWRLDQAIPVLTNTLRDSAMTKAISTVDPKVRDALNQIQHDFDFARANQRSLDDFDSPRLKLTGTALRFDPQAKVPFTVEDFRRDARGVLAALREEHLDSAAFKPLLAVPIEVQARVQLQPHSKALFGFSQGTQAVRIYADFRYKRTAVVASAQDGSITFGHAESNDNRVLSEMQLNLKVDVTGQLAYSINGQAFKGLDGYRFDPKQAIQFVIQDLHLQEEPIGGIEVRALSVSAQRPR